MVELRTGHAKWKTLAEFNNGTKLMDVEHLRFQVDATSNGEVIPDVRVWRHVAAVTFVDGSSYVGVATQSAVDQYKRTVGYNISVGRALKRAAENCDTPDFYVDNELTGRDFAVAVRAELVKQGYIEPKD